MMKSVHYNDDLMIESIENRRDIRNGRRVWYTKEEEAEIEHRILRLEKVFKRSQHQSTQEAENLFLQKYGESLRGLERFDHEQVKRNLRRKRTIRFVTKDCLQKVEDLSKLSMEEARKRGLIDEKVSQTILIREYRSNDEHSLNTSSMIKLVERSTSI